MEILGCVFIIKDPLLILFDTISQESHMSIDEVCLTCLN